MSSNDSGFTSGNPNAPNGTQVAFIKNNASISQTVYLDAGVYNLSFLAAQRVNYQTQNQESRSWSMAPDVGLIVPDSPVIVNNATYTIAYATYQSSNFTVTAGTHTVELLGMSPSTADSTAFIDEVAITPVVDSIVDGGFEQPALAVKCLPDRSQRLGLAVLGNGRRGQQWQRLRHELDGSPERPRGNAGRLPSGQRQHEPDRVPGRRHLPALVPGRPACDLPDELSGNRGPGR